MPEEIVWNTSEITRSNAALKSNNANNVTPLNDGCKRAATSVQWVSRGSLAC